MVPEREAEAVEAWELEAREHIRETIARYAHCVDGGRFDELVELFTADGVLEVEGEPAHRGRDAIRAFVTGTGRDLAAGTGASRIRHHVSNVVIELEGPDRAQARCYFLAVTDRGVDHWGRYRDEVVRTGDGWRFGHRQVRTDGAAPGSWVAEHRPR
jgi:3-phenylpropionate/cinnamic acid dioxygenase small subunit